MTSLFGEDVEGKCGASSNKTSSLILQEMTFRAQLTKMNLQKFLPNWQPLSIIVMRIAGHRVAAISRTSNSDLQCGCISKHTSFYRFI
jgi:hypothetical protein